VKAGLRAIAEDGPEGFSLRAVAARAGVTAPAVYRHFADKESLLGAIGAECADRLAEAITTAVKQTKGDSLARYRAVGIAIVQFAVSHPEHFRVMSMPSVQERIPDEQRRAAEEWHRAQRAELEAGQRAGEIADLPLDDMLLTARTAINGLANMIVSGQLGDVSKERAKELAIAVTNVLGEGLSPRRASTGGRR
jgi:AcrR family transcriptional regulator